MTSILTHVETTCSKLISTASITSGYGKYDIEVLKILSNSLIQGIQSQLPDQPDIHEMTHRDLFIYSNIIANTFELISTLGEADNAILTFFEDIVILDVSINHLGHFEELRECFTDVYARLRGSKFKNPLVTLSYKYNQLIGSYIDNRNKIVCLETQQHILSYELMKFGINVEDIFYVKSIV